MIGLVEILKAVVAEQGERAQRGAYDVVASGVLLWSGMILLIVAVCLLGACAFVLLKPIVTAAGAYAIIGGVLAVLGASLVTWSKLRIYGGGRR